MQRYLGLQWPSGGAAEHPLGAAVTDADELSDEQQRAAQIMARWAADAGYRRLWWSVPNDASWPREFLAGLPVRRDGLSSSFDLRGRRRRWHPECTVCSLIRGAGGWRVEGVPAEEWLRPSVATMPARGTEHGDLFADLTGDPEPHATEATEPLNARPRLRARLTAAAVGLAIPAAALGGVLVVTATGNQQPLTPPAMPPPVPAQTTPTPEPPPLPPGAAEWAGTAQVQLAAVTEQLATLADAEAAWMALPPEQRSGPPPAPVADLQASKAELTQRRALLEADLAAWEALHDVRTQLAGTEERLAEVRRALALSETGDTAEQLRAQEARLARQSQSQRSQLADTEEVVDTAATAPPPRQMDVTATATAVLSLATRPLAPADDPQEPSPGSAPPVAAGREIDGDSPTAAAPDDGEPDPDPNDDGPDPDPQRDSAGVVGGVVGGVVSSLPVLGDNPQDTQDVGTGDTEDTDTGDTDTRDTEERLDAISAELDGISSELDAIEADLAPVDAQPVNPFTPDPAQGSAEASANPFTPQDPEPAPGVDNPFTPETPESAPVDNTGSGLDVPAEPAPAPVAESTDLDAAVADAQAGAQQAAATLDAALADISDEDKQMLQDHLQAAADELAAQLDGQQSSSLAVTMDAPPPDNPTADTLGPPVWNPPSGL